MFLICGTPIPLLGDWSGGHQEVSKPWNGLATFVFQLLLQLPCIYNCMPWDPVRLISLNVRRTLVTVYMFMYCGSACVLCELSIWLRGQKINLLVPCNASLKTSHEKTQWGKTHQRKKSTTVDARRVGSSRPTCDLQDHNHELWFSGLVSPWTLQISKSPHANSINAFIEAWGQHRFCE
jgi:hypothetical protein